jgi:hypothetical protein
MVNLIEILEPKKSKCRSGYVDYNRFSYCKGCDIKKPREMIHCDDCGRPLRHNPSSKRAKYWEKEMKYID